VESVGNDESVDTMGRRYLTTAQLAQTLGLADSTIRHYRSAGRIKPSSQTPGGHARYDLEEVAASLGIDPIAAEEPQITGLTHQTFAPPGQHDLREARNTGALPDEMVALGVREAAEPRPATHRSRWGGELLNAHRKAPA
jgi:hypothetical protein